jgi:hypothetical protein
LAGKNVQDDPAGQADTDRVPIAPYICINGADAAAASDQMRLATYPAGVEIKYSPFVPEEPSEAELARYAGQEG